MKSILLALLAPAFAIAAPKPLFQSKVIDEKTPNHSVEIDVDVSNAKELFLVVTDGGNGFGADWADWAEPRLLLADGSEKKLTEIEWKSAQAGFGDVRVNSNVKGGELRSAGKAIEYGIGTHANSVITFNLPAGVKRFKARGALDEGGTKQGGGTSVEFRVYTENPGPLKASAVAGASHEPADSTEQLDVHPELVVQLFASEPMMASPASIDIDARGRVWVCEVVNYRKHNGERAEGDRILILEDTDGDAKADKSTVFHQGRDVDSAHGICVLGNKALISCGDDVFWLIDDNGDDKADRKELMFTKIGGAQHDHGIHAFHFGPDGRLYFNFGNAGKQLCDKDGNLITDIHGVKCTNQNNRPYQQGMVFRCELDGSNVEVLAWNFRNNWEVAVDSFGTLWQSDNDDDGNKGVRINYVMEFGNYGYSDEMTGEGWQIPRIGWESEIPQRHWHQNDPGVVPNMLMTGAGSPTGMQIYEGDLLPSVFHGQPIHCDAGPNVVRAYITQPDGAGYKAEIVNILEGTKNRWFRPSDVAVAPDGSLIVADWYDPGVGGHGMGDVTRGRLFRVTTKAALKYQIADFKLDTVEGAVAALKSPNEEQRYLAWKKIEEIGSEAEPELYKLFDDKKSLPQHRARALWLLAGHEWERINPGADKPNPHDLTLPDSLTKALADTAPNIRITAIRVARRLVQQAHPEMLREVIAKVVKDASPAVRREAAIALRFDVSDRSNTLWGQLARKHIRPDRFMSEAMGIGAEKCWPERLASTSTGEAPEISEAFESAMVDLMLRARGNNIPNILANALTDPADSGYKLANRNGVRFLRSLQFQPATASSEVARAALTIFLKADAETALASTALLDRNVIASNPEAKARLDSLLKPVIGKPEFIDLVQRLNLTGFEQELVDYITAHPDAGESITAARILAANTGKTVAFLTKADAASAKKLVAALGKVSDRPSVAVLNQAFWPEKRDDVRRSIVEALALSSEGGRALLKWQSEKKLPDTVKTTAALALSRSTDAGLRNQAATELPLPAALGAEKFPPLADLMKLKGDAAKGQAMFMQAGCVACHQVKGQFINFGPDLTQIGNKLSKDGLFTAVLYPSAAVEHSFGGLTVTTKEGQTVLGYVVSETDVELTLKMAGGATQAIKKTSIVKKEEMKDSLMPPGLAAAIGPQGLADLVAYLQTLK
ncbi:PVC-type heme-binding CxxCH protein [Prosthecobacter sp.]|uniref:PVC-type heme-binding CxxCH protein n=1 Tax=Prosthecobacter sp. TaxID=1965333 RepID=UPI002ABA7EDD|nr:PVC-type heme-binding CxxCH protein [Prosthecobacter sp.]MDZ4405520.1 PVC-type heme-binding CxxCH protein [Prosthecobacter sp.]